MSRYLTVHIKIWWNTSDRILHLVGHVHVFPWTKALLFLKTGFEFKKLIVSKEKFDKYIDRHCLQYRPAIEYWYKIGWTIWLPKNLIISEHSLVGFFLIANSEKGSVYMQKWDRRFYKGSFPRLLKFVSQNEFIYL